MSLDLATVTMRARNGDSYAIHELYEAYADQLRRYCYNRVGDIDVAQDCVQEVFVRVWKSINTFEYRGEPSFLGWLYTIANNVVITYIRQQKRNPSAFGDPDLNLADPRNTDSPLAICDRIVLAQAIGELTAEQQQVITLKFFVGLSNLEIAEGLNRTEGAVKALQHRAINTLGRILSREQMGQQLDVMAVALG